MLAEKIFSHKDVDVLLYEAYAGAFSGLGAMLLDTDEIRRADADELKEIARRYGR